MKVGDLVRVNEHLLLLEKAAPFAICLGEVNGAVQKILLSNGIVIEIHIAHLSQL